MANRILFLTLKVFGATGGIEKVCRVVGKSLYELTLLGRATAQVYCMHDKQSDATCNKYFPMEMFRGFGGAKARFIFAALQEGRRCDTVILSHINLLLAAWLIKLVSPKTKIILFAHGIEIWVPLRKRQRMMLQCCDRIIAVSNYTSMRVQQQQGIPADKCIVLNNSLDPFLPIFNPHTHAGLLRKKYGYGPENKIIFTLTRLSSRERYKGYDKVLESLAELKKKIPGLRYLLAGGYDEKEKAYLDDMIAQLGLAENVHMTGFIPDEELVDHFSIADVYVMPSMKEGFGIVFIEAMYYHVPVIAGNQDGSVDALCNGELGILVDPVDVKAIGQAIEKILSNKTAFIPDRKLLMKRFSYEVYKRNFETIVSGLALPRES